MKIHATRVVAPEKGQHGTKWQVVITYDDGSCDHFARVYVTGDVQFVALRDGDEQPRVYAEPARDALVTGVKSGGGTMRIERW